MSTNKFLELYKHNKRELITFINMQEAQRAALSERCKNLQAEMYRQDKAWHKAFEDLRPPYLHAQDTDKMVQWLLDFGDGIRELIGGVGVHYAIHDYSHEKGADPKIVVLTTLYSQIMDYFDWDDK